MKSTTSFALHRLKPPRPASGVDDVGVICGSCGATVQVSFASATVALARRRQKIMAVRAGLSVAAGLFVLAALIGGTGDSPIAGWIGTASLITLLATFVHLIPMSQQEFGVWVSGAQPLSIQEVHMIRPLRSDG